MPSRFEADELIFLGRWHMSLTPSKKDQFRHIPEQKLDKFLTGNIYSVNNNNIQIENQPDPMDRATIEAEISFSLVLRERKEEMITRLGWALERLDDGTYGTCEACGEEISERRLKVRPEARFCIYCKRQQEADFLAGFF